MVVGGFRPFLVLVLTKFLKYSNQELMVPSTLDRDIFSTDSAIHQTSQGLDK